MRSTYVIDSDQWKESKIPSKIGDEKIAPGKIHHLEYETRENENFRKVVLTSQFQLVLMSLKPGEDIGEEVHPHTDQFFRIEEGKAIFVIEGKPYRLVNGDAITIFAGSKHNVINPSKTEKLKLYTIYVPPQHPPDKIQATKE